MPAPRRHFFCTVADCGREHHARGLCVIHYHRVDYMPLVRKPFRRNLLAAQIEEMSETMRPSKIRDALGVTMGVVSGALSRARKAGRIDDGKWTPHVPTRDPFPPPGRCLWMDGDPSDPTAAFCGGSVSRIGTAWCAEHRAIVYRPFPPRKTEVDTQLQPDALVNHAGCEPVLLQRRELPAQLPADIVAPEG